VPPAGRYLWMEADPRQPVNAGTILSETRWICASSAGCAGALAVLLLTGSLLLHEAWLFVGACMLAGVLAWEIYPRAGGIRYSTGFVEAGATVRSLCLAALSKALDEDVPIESWHPRYFDIIQTPADGSEGEFAASSWIHTRALLGGDLETARRYIERRLALLPESVPVTQYLEFGGRPSLLRRCRAG